MDEFEKLLEEADTESGELGVTNDEEGEDKNIKRATENLSRRDAEAQGLGEEEKVISDQLSVTPVKYASHFTGQVSEGAEAQNKQKTGKNEVKRERLGDKLLRYRAVTQDQLEHALKLAEETNEMLGVVLINNGMVSQETLLRVMHMSGKKSRLGEILLREGSISGADLEEALAKQKKTGTPLGQILIEDKKISEKQYLQALSRTMNMPIKRLKGFVPKTSLNEIVRERVSIMCDSVVYLDSPQLLELVVSQPYDSLVEDLRILIPDREIKVYLTYADELRAAIREYSRLSSASTVRYRADQPDPEDETLVAPEDSRPDAAIRAVNEILGKAVRANASDIFLQPVKHGGLVRIRKNGRLSELPTSVSLKKIYPQVISRIKILTNSMDINEHRIPQNGSFSASFSEYRSEHEVRFEVNTVLTEFGESASIHILDQDQVKTDLEKLEYSPPLLRQYSELLDDRGGILLVTGPADSGKTSTLYATINAVRERFPLRNIVSAEESVEYRYGGDEVRQSRIMPSQGVGYAELVRSFIDQRPDVILIGEIRDADTAREAIRAAQRGILVVSSVSSSDAVSAVEQIENMGVSAGEFLSAVKGILCQRLIEKNCPECTVEYDPPEKQKQRFFGEDIPEDVTFWHGKGCSSCLMTGVMGRIPLAELWVPDAEQRAMAAGGVPVNEVRKDAEEKGMWSFRSDSNFRLQNKEAALHRLQP